MANYTVVFSTPPGCTSTVKSIVIKRTALKVLTKTPGGSARPSLWWGGGYPWFPWLEHWFGRTIISSNVLIAATKPGCVADMQPVSCGESVEVAVPDASAGIVALSVVWGNQAVEVITPDCAASVAAVTVGTTTRGIPVPSPNLHVDAGVMDAVDIETQSESDVTPLVPINLAARVGVVVANHVQPVPAPGCALWASQFTVAKIAVKLSVAVDIDPVYCVASTDNVSVINRTVSLTVTPGCVTQAG